MNKPHKDKRKNINICKEFYSKCRNYNMNLSKIEENRLEYQKVINEMYGIKSVVIKEIVLENTGDPNHTWNHELVDKKDILLLQRAGLLYDTIIVDKVLHSVSNDVEKMIIECYINSERKHDVIAEKFKRSRDKMYRDMNKEVIKVLKIDTE